MFINPLDNTRNLSQEYLQSLQNAPESYRRRFFLGQYTAETDGALWSYERLEQIRVRKADLPVMSRIVVAVDLSGCRGPEETRSDEIGIVVAGKGLDGRPYVLGDYSGCMAPADWARRAVFAYHYWKGDAVVCERNFGGAMVAETLRHADPNIPIREVVASRGKMVRAEPVAGLRSRS